MQPIEEKHWWSQHAKVYIEDGGMSGVLVLECVPPSELVLTLDGLQEYLQTAGIQYGIDSALCQNLIRDPGAYVNERLTVAKGKPPVQGQDARIEVHVDDGTGRRPKMRDDGRVDFFDMGSVNLVKQGQVLAIRIPPGPGEDGIAVTGQPIPGKRGRDCRLPQGQNTAVEQDGCVLVAATDGHVVYNAKDNKIHVFDEYVVEKDVDFSVGNIVFTGSVRVLGNVQPGFKIVAEGDVDIHGYMDAAVIEAGGNVTVRGGVQGRNKGVIRAGGHLRTPFIQNAEVDVGGSCMVGDSIMHSRVNAASKVVMEGRKAVIVGGTVRAGEVVVTRVLGSPMATPTAVEVGVHPHLRAELGSINESLKKVAADIDKTRKAITLLEQMETAGGGLPPDKATLLQKLRMTLEHYKVEEEDLQFRRSQIERALQDVKSAQVQVLETVYPGVKVAISHYTYYVRDPLAKVCFVMRDAEVRAVPLR